MNRQAAIRAIRVLSALILLAPALVTAAEPPPPLAEMWVLTIKPGHGEEFRAALKEHMAFRAEHGDPRAWQAYTPVLGDEMNRVAVRYCCVNWADVDSYREWSMNATEVGEHFDSTVGAHVAGAAHYFETIDWANSHWSDAGGPYRLFAVTEWDIKPGHNGELSAAVDKMSQIALEQGWASDAHNWLWTSRIGDSPQLSIVVPHRNYASFEQEEDTFFRFLAEQLGSEEKAAEVFQQFGNATTESEFQIWAHRDDLSMADDD